MTTRPVAWVVAMMLFVTACSSRHSEPMTEATVSATALAESVGVGSCSPDVALANHVVDCRFPVDADPMVIDRLDGRATAVIRTGENSDDLPERSWPCVVDGGELICRRLYVQERVSSVGIDVGSGNPVWDLATLTVAPASASPARAVILQLTVAPGVFAGVATRVDVFREQGNDAVWGLVRGWPEREVVDTVGLLTAGESHASVFFTIADPGVYELTMCEGADPTICSPAPSGHRFQVLGQQPLELVSGHNDKVADRINIIITGGGFASSDEFISAARMLMTPVAGPVLVGVGDSPIRDERTPRSVWFPPFAIDPLREMANKVNVWYLDEPVDSSGADRGFLSEGEWADMPSEFSGLTDLAFVHLVAMPYGADVLEPRDPEGGGGASLVSFRGSVEPPESQQEIRFGLAMVGVEPERPWRSTNILVHELGHSLFGLDEEYFGPDEIPGLQEPNEEAEGLAPNNAVNLTQAELWWGGLVGEVDPFFYEYRGTLLRFGLWDEKEHFDFETALTVGYFPKPEGIKPTGYSIMAWHQPEKGAIPVFGSVNRLRATQILDLWTGA